MADSLQAAENLGLTRAVPSMMLLGNVSAEQVVGLVETVGGHASSIDAAHLAEESREGADLLPILTVAEMFGLVKTQKENVAITELGLKLCGISNYRDKLLLLRDALAKTEPCKTALVLISNQGTASVHQIANALQKQGMLWNQNHEINESTIRSLLVDWGVQADLLRRNKRGEFQNFSQTRQVRASEANVPSEGAKATFRAKMEARAAARHTFRKSKSAARKKYEEARRAAWKNYRDDIAAAKRVYKEALAPASKKNA